MINFVGAGPGAADLITVRGMRLLEAADVIIYAGSLVNRELLEYASDDCVIYDSAKMTLEEIIKVMIDSEEKGLKTVRLQTGDPSIYGAICEQMRELDRAGIEYSLCPGGKLHVRCGGGAEGGIYAAGGQPERNNHKGRGQDACPGGGKHRELCFS